MKGAKIGTQQSAYEDDNSSTQSPGIGGRRNDRGIADSNSIPPPAHMEYLLETTGKHTHRIIATGHKRSDGKVYTLSECADPDCGYQERKALI